MVVKPAAVRDGSLRYRVTLRQCASTIAGVLTIWAVFAVIVTTLDWRTWE